MRISDYSIRTRLIGLSLISILFTLAVGLFGINQVGKVNHLVNEMFASDLITVADVANANMQAIYHNRALYAYVIESEQSGMDKVGQTMQGYEAGMHKVLEKYRKTNLTTKEIDLLRKFDSAWALYMPLATKVQKHSYADQNKEAMELMNTEVSKTFQVADDLLSDIVNLNIELGRQSNTDADETARLVRIISLAVIFAAVAVSIGLSMWIIRTVTAPLSYARERLADLSHGDLSMAIRTESKDETGQLLQDMEAVRHHLHSVVSTVRDNSESVATGAGEIAQGNADLSQRTEEQASALEETAATMDELGSTVRNNADNARQANQLALGASQIATRGGDVVGEVVETMQGINDSSKKIADIITVIDGIAFQTNILALNAAVEAARAGEQGRGFAVVAGEVRSLAQRSADAAKEIKTLINDSVERVEQGTLLVDRAGTTMTEIVGAIKRVSDIVSEISSATTEQSSGIAQVGEAVTQMDKVTQQNAALVEESAAAAESLRVQATQLVQAVATFKLR
ncbi:methyl-accepting chemotaxis protein [Paucibacter sp. Y2R2-4]|uniref:methyl-accepting chemotaxis protein n=1 Tax=Paucibacter sp. Y2R2-4 TaxID=2893553 RepID=UPI0029620719|nr:methyl-accepting chemotaxis protein [Paucibacter sp. Y2R2-4]